MASRVTLCLNFQKSVIMSCREDYKEVRANSDCLLPVRVVGIRTCSQTGTTDMYKKQFWTRKLEMESWLGFLISCLPHNQCQEQHPSGVSLKSSVSLHSYSDPQIVLTCHGQRSLLCRVLISVKQLRSIATLLQWTLRAVPVLLSPYVNHLRDIKELKVQIRTLRAPLPDAQNPLQDPPLPPELPWRVKQDTMIHSIARGSGRQTVSFSQKSQGCDNNI